MAAAGGDSGRRPRECGMAGEQAEDGEENILYDLLVNAEWPPETEVQVRVASARAGEGTGHVGAGGDAAAPGGCGAAPVPQEARRDGRAGSGGHTGCPCGHCPLVPSCRLIPTVACAAWGALKCSLLIEQCMSGFTVELTQAKLW